MLAIMVFPVIISVSDEVLRAVPSEYRRSRAGSGSDQVRDDTQSGNPQSAPGLVAAVVLGVSRALGETMAVLMVAGNVPVAPEIGVRRGLSAAGADREQLRRSDVDSDVRFRAARIGAGPADHGLGVSTCLPGSSSCERPTETTYEAARHGIRFLLLAMTATAGRSG